MRAILVGGGTGGHVIPALAIAQELKARYAAEVVFVGTARGIENRLVPAAGFQLRLIQVGALNKVDLATRLRTLFALPMAVAHSHSILSEFRPDVVIGVGGYASGPMMLAAVIASVPTVAFEPNLVPGLANRIVGPMVSAAAVQFEATCRSFRRCIVTGVPVRQAFFEVRHSSGQLAERVAVGDRPAAKMRGEAAVASRPPSLLIFGGSQGAHALNQTVTDALPRFHEHMRDLYIVHQTGERDYQPACEAYLHAGVKAELHKFIDDMPAAFASADLLVCRSGASTVAEITAAGKPAIFVPFPHAADDHQTHNAAALARSGAAILIRESELTAQRLFETVRDLLTDRARLARMAEAAGKLAHPDAAARIAALAARLGGMSER
jgi:UDP-N-acetylglucosamine--N-acetylmuramyl-(pentapeptide) pyrophosphoryl-undecaprenol N-acetylglucosamine transferase